MSDTPINSAPTAAPINLILTREELALMVRLFERPTFLGLDADPMGELTDAQEAYGFVYAERSLRARELARISPEGQLQIQSDLLNAVGICTFAQKSFVASRFTSDGASDRLIIHTLADQAVALSNPGAALYRLVTLAGRTAILEQLVAACLLKPEAQADTSYTLQLSAETLAAARQAAQQQDRTATISALVSDANFQETAQAACEQLATTLIQPYALTTIHILTPQSGNQVLGQQFSVIEGEAGNWLMIEKGESGGESTQNERRYTLSTTTAANLHQLLESLI